MKGSNPWSHIITYVQLHPPRLKLYGDCGDKRCINGDNNDINTSRQSCFAHAVSFKRTRLLTLNSSMRFNIIVTF